MIVITVLVVVVGLLAVMYYEFPDVLRYGLAMLKYTVDRSNYVVNPLIGAGTSYIIYRVVRWVRRYSQHT